MAQELGPAATFVHLDVTRPAEWAAAVATTVATYGTLNVLVNNAGGAPATDSATASPQFHDKIIGLNLSAPLMVAQIANRVMQGQASGGSIVNISSIGAHRPAPTIAAYAASKAGLDSLTRSLARNTATLPISSGRAMRPSGMVRSIAATDSSPP